MTRARSRRPPPDPRMKGLPPFTLQRACELVAAFEVLCAVPYVQDKAKLRRKLAAMEPRDLHGAVGRILAHIPARRFR